MEKLTLRQLAIPLIKSIDSFNYLLKSHHRRTAVISYHIGKQLKLEGDELLELVIAASIHDIGALSVMERDMLIKEDVANPLPHCIMGYQMLAPFKIFKNIAQIIKHHHINFLESQSMEAGEVPKQSFIIHLADRVDVSIKADEFILTQRDFVQEKIRLKSGSVFDPKVFDAFMEASRSDIFWIDIDNLSIEQLFNKLDFSLDLELSFDNILEFALTLSRVVDYRSRFTVSHSYSVAQLSERFGHYFNYTDVECKKLKIAGYLHDIGKIGIDPGLLEKNGPLNDEEFQKIKLHPYFTEQILMDLQKNDWFRDVITWAAQHHEKSDGTGYPHGLKDEEIAEGSKIIAFADVITALIEDRPYRAGMTANDAFDLIKAKIAPSISNKMFEILETKKGEISELMVECKKYASNEYKKGIINP